MEKKLIRIVVRIGSNKKCYLLYVYGLHDEIGINFKDSSEEYKCHQMPFMADMINEKRLRVLQSREVEC
jgi:hypothetical protein